MTIADFSRNEAVKVEVAKELFYDGRAVDVKDDDYVSKMTCHV